MQEHENKQELINDNEISIVETITPAEAGRILRKTLMHFYRKGIEFFSTHYKTNKHS